MIRYLLHLSLLFPLLWQLVNMLLKFCIYVRLKVTLTCFGDNFLCQENLIGMDKICIQQLDCFRSVLLNLLFQIPHLGEKVFPRPPPPLPRLQICLPKRTVYFFNHFLSYTVTSLH